MIAELRFEIVGAAVEPYAIAPTIGLKVRATEAAGARIQAIALRADVSIEPQRRRYAADESARLVDLFGPAERYGETLRAIRWVQASHMVLAFSGETTFELALPCSYDFERAANKYLSALADGDIPLEVMFSGMVFVQGENGLVSEFVPWSCDASYRLDAGLWRAAVDTLFPDSAWLRVGRDVFDELNAFRIAGGAPSWDVALRRLVELARVRP